MPEEKTVFDIDKRSSKTEQALERVFIISILFKLIFGAAEAVTGVVLLFVTYGHIEKVVDHINSWVVFGYQPHLSAVTLADQRMFVALYAILHGIPKVVLALILIRRKLWGYPLSLVILAGFIVYQLIEIASGHNLAFMVALTLFDGFVCYMIIHEWHRDKALFEREAAKAGRAKPALEVASED